ncbi:MAG TPA: class I SAM-dependent methyltransferase [Acidimicrobiales bacterium]|nr:class I SAM-dependent methyltransferase [Acidimicrobiales bacterium]
MADDDRARWDARHADAGGARTPGEPECPAVFAPYEDVFPTAGFALDVACGRGAASVWLAARGLEVCGVDYSATALAGARRLADAHQLGDRCRFELVDLALGLPPGPPAGVVLCHMFRQPSLYGPIIGRLGDGGVVAVAVLSEVDAHPGPFRAAAGELKAAFRSLSVIAEGEADGRAWLVARK